MDGIRRILSEQSSVSCYPVKGVSPSLIRNGEIPQSAIPAAPQSERETLTTKTQRQEVGRTCASVVSSCLGG